MDFKAARNDSFGRPYELHRLQQIIYLFIYLFLFRHRISELPWSIAVKLCHMIVVWLNFTMQVQKYWRLSCKKLMAKNMQNLVRFYTTSDFDREYLQSETQISKIGKTWSRTVGRASHINIVGHTCVEICTVACVFTRIVPLYTLSHQMFAVNFERWYWGYWGSGKSPPEVH